MLNSRVIAQVDAGEVAGITIPARVTIRVVAICLVMILAEGCDVAMYGDVLPMLTHGTDWSLSPFQLGAIASYSVAGMMIGVRGTRMSNDIIGRCRCNPTTCRCSPHRWRPPHRSSSRGSYGAGRRGCCLFEQRSLIFTHL